MAHSTETTEILVLRNHAKGVLPGEDNNFGRPFNRSHCTSGVKSMDGALLHGAQHMNGHHRALFLSGSQQNF